MQDLYVYINGKFWDRVSNTIQQVMASLTHKEGFEVISYQKRGDALEVTAKPSFWDSPEYFRP